MPINVYTGLMRSGKSFEVVSEVIVPAVRTGRRVVTNVDGISEEKIHAYLTAKYPAEDPQGFGRILHVTNSQVFEPDFFPYYDDHKGAHTDTLVQPGDLVCIDEAWRFWPASGAKIHKNHTSFFLEHGHFTNEKTGVACDLVLMIQDMGTLNRHLKSVVAFNCRTHKKVSLGMGNTYSVSMYEGHKQTKATQIGNWVRRYRKEIFPLYSSFKGGVDGKTVNTDARQNVFSNSWLWIGAVVFVVVGIASFYKVWMFFHPVELGKDGKPLKTTATPSSAPGATATPNTPVKSSVPSPSETWRISGRYQAQGRVWVVLVNASGAMRVESPSMFQNSGYAQSGEIDGSRVFAWSGVLPVSQYAAPASSAQSSPRFPGPK